MTTSKIKLIERKIMFYHLRTRPNLFVPHDKIDIPSLLSAIKGLQFQRPINQQSNYWQNGNEDKIYCCFVDEIWNNYCSVRFCKVRQNDLPQIELNGNLAPLTLHSDAGIAEITHVMFFPDNIIGAEFNYFGPRIPLFIRYLSAKAPVLTPDMACDLIVKGDIAEKLDRVGGISLVKLRIIPSFIGVVEEIDEELGKGFISLNNSGEPDIIEVIMSKRNRKPLKSRLTDAIKKMFRRADFGTEVVDARVRSIDSDEELDLLGDHFITKRSFPRSSRKVRQVESQQMYAAIKETYEQLHDELLTSVGVNL